MKLAMKISIAALMTTSVSAAGGNTPYAYLLNGADWPYLKTGEWYCDKTNQAPIDLRTDMHSNPFPKEDGNDLTMSYTDWKGATCNNKGMVVQVDVPNAGSGGTSPDNYFESTYSADSLKGPKKFSAA